MTFLPHWNLKLTSPSLAFAPAAIRAPPIYPIREIRIPHLDMTRLFLSRVRSEPPPKSHSQLSVRCPVFGGLERTTCKSEVPRWDAFCAKWHVLECARPFGFGWLLRGRLQMQAPDFSLLEPL